MEVTVLRGWVEKKIRCLRCSHSKTNVGGRDEVNFHPTNIGPVVTSLLLLLLLLLLPPLQDECWWGRIKQLSQQH